MSGPAINHKSTTPTLNDENSVTALQEREYQIWLKEFHAEQAAVEAAVEANIRATMESNARKVSRLRNVYNHLELTSAGRGRW